MAFNANYNRSSKKNHYYKLNEGKDAALGYIAEVVLTKDVSRTGRCRVFIRLQSAKIKTQQQVTLMLSGLVPVVRN